MRIEAFQAVFPKLDLITSNESFFGSVKYEYPEYVKSGFFEPAAEKAMYIYQIRTPYRNFTGLVNSVQMDDYTGEKIKKHEKTLAAKEQKHIHLMLQRHAMIKPVLLTYPEETQIHTYCEQFIKGRDPYFKIYFEEEEQEHIFWQIAEETAIDTLKTLFREKVPECYIADGHHRSSTTAILRERMGAKTDAYDQLLCAFFPADELEILDYNRIVEGLEDVSPAMFMAKLSHHMDITPIPGARKPKKKHEIVMFFQREWYSLEWRPHVLEKWKKAPVLLDASLLDKIVLKEIFGIEDVQNDNRVKYVEGPLGIEAVKNKTLKKETRIAFCLYPVALEDIFYIVDHGGIMPPKSTWFEPRMRNGLIVKEC